MTRVADIPFVKGHATENDFVVLPDLEGRLELSAERVRWICDRRRGIGADGVLRVVRCANDPEFASFADVAGADSCAPCRGLLTTLDIGATAEEDCVCAGTTPAGSGCKSTREAVRMAPCTPNTNNAHLNF